MTKEPFLSWNVRDAEKLRSVSLSRKTPPHVVRNGLAVFCLLF